MIKGKVPSAPDEASGHNQTASRIFTAPSRSTETSCDTPRSTDTRFIIITHNPITMARMNRLYGVTMAERGVSQLVSVDLEGAVQIRDSAVA